MPSYNNHKKTNRYTQEFKSKAVLLSHLTGVQVKDVAPALDIHPCKIWKYFCVANTVGAAYDKEEGS